MIDLHWKLKPFNNESKWLKHSSTLFNDAIKLFNNGKIIQQFYLRLECKPTVSNNTKN